MADSVFSRMGAKMRHIGANILYSAGTGLRMGLAVGAVLGVGAVLLAGAPIFSVGALGVVAAYTGATALNCTVLGAIWGGIKGALTRDEPNSTELMQEAQQCGVEVMPEQARAMTQPAPAQAQAQAAPVAAQRQGTQPQPAMIPQPMQAPQAGQGQQLQVDALAQIQKMTEMLGQEQRQDTKEQASQPPVALPGESHQDRIPARRGSDMKERA